MCIHPQCDRFVRVPQLFRYTGYIGAVGYGDTGKAVAQFMRVQMTYTVFLFKVLQVPRGGLWMHRLCAAFLGEYVRAHNRSGLCEPQLLQESHYIRIHINGLLAKEGTDYSITVVSGVESLSGLPAVSGTEVDIDVLKSKIGAQVVSLGNNDALGTDSNTAIMG